VVLERRLSRGGSNLGEAVDVVLGNFSNRSGTGLLRRNCGPLRERRKSRNPIGTRSSRSPMEKTKPKNKPARGKRTCKKGGGERDHSRGTGLSVRSKKGTRVLPFSWGGEGNQEKRKSGSLTKWGGKGLRKIESAIVCPKCLTQRPKK